MESICVGTMSTYKKKNCSEVNSILMEDYVTNLP